MALYSPYRLRIVHLDGTRVAIEADATAGDLHVLVVLGPRSWTGRSPTIADAIALAQKIRAEQVPLRWARADYPGMEVFS